MATYKVAGRWQKGEYVYNNKIWKHRRLVHTYEYGNPMPLGSSYEYKNMQTVLPTSTTGVATTGGLAAPATPYVGTGVGSMELPEGRQGLMPEAPLSPIVGMYEDPTRDQPISELGGVQAALYQKYTDYQDTVDYFNNDLRSQVEYYFEISQAKYGYDDDEKNTLIEKEFSRYEIPKRSYTDWLAATRQGTISDIMLYQPPTLAEEAEAASPIVKGLNDILYATFGKEEGLQKIYKGMQIGWDIANATGLTRIAAMGLAGMPDQLVKSMAVSTQLVGMTERLMGQQDVITRTLVDLADVSGGLRRSQATSAEHYKTLYTRLNEQAKKRGIIKGDWTLRLSRNIPIKERWRRLYVTLLAHVEKTEAKKRGKA